jgi:hypothetical protein
MLTASFSKPESSYCVPAVTKLMSAFVAAPCSFVLLVVSRLCVGRTACNRRGDGGFSSCGTAFWFAPNITEYDMFCCAELWGRLHSTFTRILNRNTTNTMPGVLRTMWLVWLYFVFLRHHILWRVIDFIYLSIFPVYHLLKIYTVINNDMHIIYMRC